MKKIELNNKITDEDIEYLKQSKINLMEMELVNDSIFGDDAELKKLRLINNLQDWEKNIYLLYIKYNSYRKVAEKMNVEKTTINNSILKIKNKLKNEYKNNN